MAGPDSTQEEDNTERAPQEEDAVAVVDNEQN